MARKKKSKIPPSVIKLASLSFIVLVIGFGVFKATAHLLMQSDYFRIKTIMIDPALESINKRDLTRLRGQNIFKVNLQKEQKRLAYKYPNIAQLKLEKNFPNQILVTAKKRKPFLQINIKNTTLTLDDKAVVLSTTGKKNKELPYIIGAESSKRTVRLGYALRGQDIRIASDIVKAFKRNKTLAPYRIATIDVKNLSKISFHLSNNLKVLIDRDKIDQNLKILGLILTRGQVDVKQMRYVDLRFKEPIIGKK